MAGVSCLKHITRYETRGRRHLHPVDISISVLTYKDAKTEKRIKQNAQHETFHEEI